MAEKIQQSPRKTPRKYRTEEFMGFKLRFIDPSKQSQKGDRHRSAYWLVDNCKAGKSRTQALQPVNKQRALRRIIKKKKNSLPKILKQRAAARVRRLPHMLQCVQPQSIASGAVQAQALRHCRVGGGAQKAQAQSGNPGGRERVLAVKPSTVTLPTAHAAHGSAQNILSGGGGPCFPGVNRSH